MTMIDLRTVMDALWSQFQPIFEASKNSAQRSSDTQEILAILESDLTNIGTQLSSADDFGERTEFVLLAECIAHLRRKTQLIHTTPLEEQIDYLSAFLGARNKSNAARTVKHEIELPIPTSWELVRTLKNEHKISPEMADAFKEALVDVMYLFIFRDGNVTDNENIILNQYKELLNSN